MSDHSVKTRKKLIEVALPLEAINAASAREKSIRHGHPSTLHLWWARRPLAAARAVIFAQMVDDPSAWPERFPTEEEQVRERQRLFRIIEQLVLWENTTNERVLEAARAEIRRCWLDACEDNKDHPRAAELFNPDQLPDFHDPFCGGGALPLEAQRLGFKAHASDLNPVAVLITKAMIEIPPKFAGRPPVGPLSPSQREQIPVDGWTGATGLGADVRRYGAWMREQALQRIGSFYPTALMEDGAQKPPLAWLWARTVTCPNPGCGIQMPLVRSFVLSTKKGKERFLRPVVSGGSVDFEVCTGHPANPGTVTGRHGATCVACGTTATLAHVRSEARHGRMGRRLMAVVVDGGSGRIYLAGSRDQEDVAESAAPAWGPEEAVTSPSHDVDRLPMYGMLRWRDAFTPRQLLALTTFVDVIPDVHKHVISSGGDHEYASAVATYLAFAISRSADYWSSISTWSSHAKMEAIRNTFARQAIPMTWDFAEANPFSASSGNWNNNVEWIAKFLDTMTTSVVPGTVVQLDARDLSLADGAFVSTDPPYYDNVGYADLSDFFYVWLRKALAPYYPDLFSTVLTPKSQELVAMPHRHEGQSETAHRFFENGLRSAFAALRRGHRPDVPLAVFYAFKQQEGAGGTGWDSMLNGLLGAGYSVTGTWPIRTEYASKITAKTNILASSIVLSCRPQIEGAPITSTREFRSALNDSLPGDVSLLQHGNIAPVDLAQASIGPGMAVFTRYSKVLDADGSAVSVQKALALINQTLDTVISEQESEFDPDTRWALAWFEQHGFAEGGFGQAEVLARAKNTSIKGLQDAGVIAAGHGKVRLLQPSEMQGAWDPRTDARLTVWEATQHLLRSLDRGESVAALLAAQLGGIGDASRDLSYRLFLICERKKLALEALSYNALVQSWPEIQRLAAESAGAPVQGTLEV